MLSGCAASWPVKVLSPFSTSIVMQKSVPLLDCNGEPTGASIQGAVTVTLSPEEAAAAAPWSGLWVQGGTPGDPVLDAEYGFLPASSVTGIQSGGAG